MNLKIEITSKEEALEAITLLQAYTGSSVAAQAVETKTEKQEVKSDEKKSTKPTSTKSKTTTKKVEEAEPETEEEKTVEEADETSDEVEETEASDIDLKQLTAIAKEAVERTDRGAAKKVISKYGSKLSEVDESDYSKLAKELEELGA